MPAKLAVGLDLRSSPDIPLPDTIRPVHDMKPWRSGPPHFPRFQESLGRKQAILYDGICFMSSSEEQTRGDDAFSLSS